MVRVLLEEDLADHPGDLERELLVRREGVRADEPDDFLELRLLLQGALRPRSQLRPLLVHVLPEPLLQDLRVQAVRLKPVDRREVPPSPQGGVQGPEHLHDAEGALGDGLREVPAARGHGADDTDGSLEATQRLRPTGAFVELAEPRGQVRGEAFFARHLFEPTRNLSHRLRPSGGRVRHQRDVVSHVSVVFGKRHARVHGRLPRGDRHVARVCDEGHPFHQGRAGVRILELREGGQDFGHLVPPLTASDVDDDLRVAPLRQLLFGHRLAGPKAARDRGGPALGDREEEIEDPLAPDERDGGHEPILYRPGPANGPGLVHPHLLAVVELRDDLVDFERALANLRDLSTAEVRGDHDPMLDVLRLLDGAHDVARPHGLTRLHLRSEGPRLFPRETRRLHPAEDEVSHHLLEDRERPLDAVVDAPEEARAQFDNERPSRIQHGFPGPDAARVLVHLDDRLLADDLDDFPQQLLLADELDVVHARAEAGGCDDRSCDSEDLPRRLAGRRFLLSFHRHVGFRLSLSDHLYRSTPIARLIFARRSSSSRLPTAITTGRGVVSSRRRIVLLRAVMSSALRIRIPTFGSSRTFATCASTPSRPTLNVFRTPASLNPWTNSSRPTAASSILHHQELPNGFGRQRTLLPSRDDSKVLDLPLLPHDVIEDWQDGQRVDVRVVPRLEQGELFNRANELTNPERLQVLEAG